MNMKILGNFGMSGVFRLPIEGHAGFRVSDPFDGLVNRGFGKFCGLGFAGGDQHGRLGGGHLP